jgi:hypothetical protein
MDYGHVGANDSTAINANTSRSNDNDDDDEDV